MTTIKQVVLAIALTVLPLTANAMDHGMKYLANILALIIGSPSIDGGF